MVCLLAIPCLDVGIGYVCGEHRIEEQVINRLITEIQSSVDGIDRLVRGAVVILRRTRQTLWGAVQMLTQKHVAKRYIISQKVVPLHHETERRYKYV